MRQRENMHRKQYLVEHLNDVLVVGLVSEVLLQRAVHGGVHEDGVIDGGQAHPLLAVPARHAAPRLRLVHYIVQHQQVRLELNKYVHIE